MTDNNDDLGEKTLKVIPFSGEANEWLDWEKKFFSKAVLCGYADILDGNTAVPPDSVPNPSDEQKKARKINTLAYHSLTVSCSGVALGIVRDAKTC